MANSVRPYAFAEMFKWRQGLDERFRGARYFYGVIILSTVVGIAMDFVGINPVKALFCTAVINGVRPGISCLKGEPVRHSLAVVHLQ